jgi:hypothetical protein
LLQIAGEARDRTRRPARINSKGKCRFEAQISSAKTAQFALRLR